MQQDYGIEVTVDWLERTTSRRFLVLISSFTKNTAIGQKILSESMIKNNVSNNKQEKGNKIKFTPTKAGVENLRSWAKSFKK